MQIKRSPEHFRRLTHEKVAFNLSLPAQGLRSDRLASSAAAAAPFDARRECVVRKWTSCGDQQRARSTAEHKALVRAGRRDLCVALLAISEPICEHANIPADDLDLV